MARLRLGALADDKPVKLSVELPGRVHRDLLRYGAALAEQTGEAAAAPEKLVAAMVEHFMAADRAFARARRPRAGTADQ